MVVGAWTDGQGERRDSLGALLLGIPEVGGLRYVGKVGPASAPPPAMTSSTTSGPWQRPTARSSSALPAGEAAKAHFVRPQLVGEVEFGEWTTAGRLRHPTWRGLRPDKAPHEVVVE